MKIAFVLGTRPEIIKMSPIIKICEQIKLNYYILHTGQHYSNYMDRIFFTQLGLPDLTYNLDIGSGSHAQQTGKLLMGIEKNLISEKPEIVLVQGDTNTVLAGALAAYKLGIEVGHVEAGLRSYDRRMPEEINRILTDHCSDYLFAPTEHSKQILLSEGFHKKNVFMTGNTIVDAVQQNLEIAQKKGDILDKLDLNQNEYFLTTVHRQENVDDKKNFSSILKGLELVQKYYDIPIIYPIHPRAKKMMKFFQLNSNLLLIDPLDFLNFLILEKNASLIFTDSGGVQEEACILGVPCVTLRDSTERPETIMVGANVLAGTKSKNILQKAVEMIDKNRIWNNPFGDGNAANKIISILKSHKI